MNNHPLTYPDEDIQLNILASSRIILGRNVRTINSTVDSNSDEWKKRPRYLQRCNENTWKKWKNEYLVVLRETQSQPQRQSKKSKFGDIVMIKGESKNRSHWKIGKVSQMYTGEDEALRAVQMQVRTKFMVQPIQVQYPLELHCDVPAKEVKVQEETNLNTGVREYRPRPNAAATADARIQDINATNDNESESK